MKKYKFTKTALDKNLEVFIIYISSLSARINVNSVRKALIFLFLIEKSYFYNKILGFC